MKKMKTIKKVFSALLAVTTIMSTVAVSVFADTTPSVSLKPSVTEVAPGGTFTIDIEIANNPGITYLAFKMNRTLTKDDGLTITNIADSALMSGANHDPEKYWNYDGLVNFAWQNPTAEEDIVVNGKVATVTYTVADTVADGTEIDFTIETNTKNKKTKNFAGEIVNFGSASTKVTVVADEPEDVIEYAEDQTFVAVAENVVDKTGVTFKFTTDYDKADPNAGSVNVPFNTYIESAEKAIVALTVTDIIEKVNDTAVSFEYVGVELY
jgi:hypothetical protein